MFFVSVAEEKLGFEHRDLHWGNLLVRDVENEEKHLHYDVSGINFKVSTDKIKVTIIDFSLSRYLI